MLQRRLLAGVTTLGLVAGGSAVAMAAGSAPKHTTINAVTSFKVKINRYIQVGTRWQKDVYDVKSGGTITVVNLAASDGPHTFSVVRKSDLPRTAKQINNCKICGTIAQEHGIDLQSQGPPTPKFLFVENGTGTNTAPNVDRPGDSAFIAPSQKAKVTLKVTAKPGTTLYFVCIIHPWMQAKLIVQK
jgi:plastocyanin